MATDDSKSEGPLFRDGVPVKRTLEDFLSELGMEYRHACYKDFNPEGLSMPVLVSATILTLSPTNLPHSVPSTRGLLVSHPLR